jgi:ATP-dependent Clp protease ATP-binding subunit ClpB
MTSNLGSRFLRERDQMSEDEISSKMMTALREFFRPEFLNRIDDVIVFHFLSREDILEIVDLQVKNINLRLQEKNLTLTLTSEARDTLAEKGYDPNFGARPLKRLLQKTILDPLAKLLIAGEIHEGDTILGDWRDGGIAFDRV